MFATSSARETVYDIRLRTPHERQEEFIDSLAKRKIVRAGRRGGKTTGMGMLAVERFMDGGRVLYAAPTEDQIASFWWECKRALAEPLDDGFLVKNETLHSIELPGTKQRIRAKTAYNADTLRGDYADLLILDEWQLMDEDAWELVGAPMLLDNDGDAVFVYTPPSLKSRSVTKARDPRHAAKLYKRAEADETGRWAAFHFSSHANPYISRSALEELAGDMTALAIRQEIAAEDIDEVPGALWTNATIERERVRFAPEMKRVVIGVDPSGGGDDIGIIGAGVSKDGHGYTLADRSQPGYRGPDNWGRAAVNLYYDLEADRIVAEKNFGGEMVEHVLRTVDPSVPVKLVHASRGKAVRAEPIAAKAEQGKEHHVGDLPELESEMTTWTPGDSWSPNRLDAKVWALTELMEKRGRTAVRMVRY